MRTTLKISALALALVMVLGMAMAFAAGSTSAVTSVVDESNNPVTTTPSSEIVDSADEAATAEGQTEPAATLQVLWNGDIGTAYAGKTLTFTVSGLADGTKVYLYHYTGTPAAWKVEGSANASGGKVTFTMPATMSPFALVASVTPQTGDNSNIALWGGLMVAAVAVAAGTVVYSRKRKNEA